MHFHAGLEYVERRDSRGPTGTNRMGATYTFAHLSEAQVESNA